jgi:hypothetical protein
MGSEALWFFAGALSFQLLSRLFRAGQLITLSTEVGARLLVLAASVHEDIYFAREIKYKKLREDGVIGDQLELITALDEKATDAWRQGIVFKFQDSLPMSLKSVFSFKDWDGAMEFMRKNMK